NDLLQMNHVVLFFLGVISFSTIASYPHSQHEETNPSPHLCSDCYFTDSGKMALNGGDLVSSVLYNNGFDSMSPSEVTEEGKTKMTILLCRLVCKVTKEQEEKENEEWVEEKEEEEEE
ncbi:hypothetical protein PMAYCL1PPCAC_17252, partial [Pristionchus mayeri]